MDALSQPALVALFLAAAAVVWWAGIHLSKAVDALDAHFGWGQALGGMILLAIVTNLPEIAIVASAAHGGHLQMAVGNILGGIAIQTVMLAVFDAFGNRGTVPLSTRASSPQLLLEGLLVIAVLAVALLGHFLPRDLMLFRVAPGGALIAVSWLAMLLLIRRSGPRPRSSRNAQTGRHRTPALARPAAMFAVTALATLAAGVTLELSGDALAGHWNMQGALFGATVLAAATSLPEIATGLPSVRRKEYALAVSDILGGNAFLPVLFLLATLLSGQAALAAAQASDLYLAALGILLTVAWVTGMVLKAARKRLGMGVDAWLLVVLYLAGVAGLFLVSQTAA